MIEIHRTFNCETGLREVENLSGLIFSPEGFAHRFEIERTDNYGYEGSITARFIRADGVTVYIQGSVRGSSVAVLDLPPECYQAPGPYHLFIFHAVIEADFVECIYAATGTAQLGETDTAIADTGTLDNIDAQIQAILDGLSDKVGYANLMAVFARNVGEIEGNIDQFQTTVDGIVDALAAADVRALNGPNLILKQPEGVTVNVPSGDVITETITIPVEDATAAAATLSYTITNANITAGMVLHGIKSNNTSVVYWGMVTGTASAGSMAVSVSARPGAHNASVTVTLFICVQTTAVLPYGEEARHYAYNIPSLDSCTNPQYTGDPGEEITERIVTLTGADIVTEEDGASYNTAVAFTVQNAPEQGYNNSDMLVFNYGNDRYKTTDTYKLSLFGEFDLQVGEKYTLSFWARITSGTDARIKMNWGNHGQYGNANSYGGSKYIDIKNTTWQRIYWTFVFNPTGNQFYTFTDTDNVTWYTENWGKKVGVGVCRKYNGTVQLCGFRLVKGGLFGNNTVDPLQISVDNMLASIAPVENGPTASAAYASGALIVWCGRLYKTSAAIASGAAFVVGTNLTATTLAQELAAMAAQVAGV